MGYSALIFQQSFSRRVYPSHRTKTESLVSQILTRHVEANHAIKPIYAALWSHNRGLELKTSNTGSWGNHVAEGTGTPSLRLDNLAASIPNARPLIVKLDIEGAEREVIESSPEVFSQAKCIVIEPHDFMNLGAALSLPSRRGSSQADASTRFLTAKISSFLPSIKAFPAITPRGRWRKGSRAGQRQQRGDPQASA